MRKSKKTDNGFLSSKLSLRHHFLNAYHPEGCDVLECCQGQGVMWSYLERDHHVRSRVGIDLKPKAGRIPADSARLLAQYGWAQDVVDIDTYGSPWAHFDAVIQHWDTSVTVFLTWGIIMMRGGGTIPQPVRRALGIPDTWTIPPSMTQRVCEQSLSYCLKQASKRFKIIECKESPRGTHARYIGVRLEIDPSTQTR
jgi:hypothetical protein